MSSLAGTADALDRQDPELRRRGRRRVLLRIAGSGVILALLLVIGIALLMTNGAVFLFTSLQNVLTTPQVFDTEQVLTASTSLTSQRRSQR